MPTYTFKNTKTGKVEDIMLSFAEHDEFKKNNPHMEQQVTTVNIVSGVQGMGRMKTDGGWKDMLSRIGDAHPGSKVHDLYGNKSIKDIKTRQVLEKHKKRQAQQKKGK
jgi:predicted nucleic acid-binding Zn ribbon protein